MKYTVEITETLQRQVTVEARDDDEALKLVKESYCNAGYSGPEIEPLSAEDYVDTEFEVL